MSTIVSRRSILGWLAALPFAKIAPDLAPKVEAAVAEAVPKVQAAAKVALETAADVFKGGPITIRWLIKGYELSDEQGAVLCPEGTEKLYTFQYDEERT